MLCVQVGAASGNNLLLGCSPAAVVRRLERAGGRGGERRVAPAAVELLGRSGRAADARGLGAQLRAAGERVRLERLHRAALPGRLLGRLVGRLLEGRRAALRRFSQEARRQRAPPPLRQRVRRLAFRARLERLPAAPLRRHRRQAAQRRSCTPLFELFSFVVYCALYCNYTRTLECLYIIKFIYSYKSILYTRIVPYVDRF